MSERMNGKNIVITGASSGIGERLAIRVAEAGAVPVLLARNEDKLRMLSDRIRETYGVEAFWYPCDLADKEAIQKCFQHLFKEVGRIDALVNNAGFGVFERVEDTSMDAFRSMFDVNVIGLIHCVKEVLPFMKEAREGHIVNIASQAGKISTPKSAGYASTKHAVLGFTNGLRMEIDSYNIGVTAVNLGPVRTNFFETADPGGTYIKSVERYMLDPDDVAKKVVEHLFTSKREINMPQWMELGAKAYQLAPGLMEKMLGKQFKKK
ncbi:SDR family NAD(P)-dependent oxidoreductase [Pontibacillus marinus]|uniref:Oxidoreductase n=1 Tax=Pontibacillus marinus BH030004 = DSM 16465 TaxID=1385511 RepID=A0A0A5G1C0_9BACI|nr:SDR family oxidoreductase [Pontibacillus marinus]KGX85839.1 oxidoreductase [Pontibacillus marinus BH030004 = DSM 16465]